MKVFKNSSLHHVHSEQITLFVTSTFSSILFHSGTKESLTGLSSFAAGLIQFTWRTSDPSPPRSPPPPPPCVFSMAPFREQLHSVQMSMMPLWAWNLLEDVGCLYHCVTGQLTWHSVFQRWSRSQFPSSFLKIEVRSISLHSVSLGEISLSSPVLAVGSWNTKCCLLFVFLPCSPTSECFELESASVGISTF